MTNGERDAANVDEELRRKYNALCAPDDRRESFDFKRCSLIRSGAEFAETANVNRGATQ